MGHGSSTEAAPDRTIPFGRLQGPRDEKSFYVSNKVRTTKYTPISFIPKNLFEQCSRFTNAYFICLCILMAMGTPHTTLFISPSSYFSTALVLLVLMSFTAGVAAYDDWRRRQADRETNEQGALVVNMDARVPAVDTKQWQSIVVGDVLALRADDELAADAVILATGSAGECFVSTTSLDGETNLKAKAAPKCAQYALCDAIEEGKGENDDARSVASTASLMNASVLTKLATESGQVVAEAPNRSINTFQGKLILGSETEGLTADNLLLRGTVLRNTPWVLALVIYTGRETRIVQNSNEVKYKKSTIDRYMNTSVMAVLVVQALISAFSAFMFVYFESQFDAYWYLVPDGRSLSSKVSLPTFIAYWLTFFILYGNLMPISLLGSMEFVNVAQKLFIEKDLKMYDKEMDVAAKARTANLCQEIGQVSYIFSDKTGTLTQNIMELKMISIGGQLFGEPGGGSGFQGAKEVERARADGHKELDSFFEVLSLCHTVMAHKDDAGNMQLEAESPDEKALVEGAIRCGWSFEGREKAFALISSPDSNGSLRRYEVLAVNAFTSDRKRASVIIRDESGAYHLLAKGADNVMLERCGPGSEADAAQLGVFARSGLRTLVLARRALDRKEFNSFMSEFKDAQQDMERRQERLAAVAEKIEVNMEVAGVTGIEDKLQDAVDETILCIRRAGIKLWVLTGDKLETARNIGFSTKVLSSNMEILVLENVDPAALEETFKGLIQKAEDALADGTDAGLLVTGAALAATTANDLKHLLLKLGELCSVVIACRVSPAQKSEMVALVRRGVKPTPVTLAVGDGANDVPMIQQAQVGVAIYGREGRQAVNSSDFAIAQFRFLQRLLLMHGRWNYRRACKLILYIYWKNALLTFLLLYYAAYSGWSGVSLFTGLLWMTFNFWTTPGICSVAIVDRDLSEEQALKHPGLYDTGRLSLELNLLKIVKMLVSAFTHSMIIWVVMNLVAPAFDSLGKGGYAVWGTAVYTGMIVNVTWRLGFVTTTWNMTVLIGQAIGPIGFVLFLWLYGLIDFWIPILDLKFLSMYGVPQQMVSQWMFWLAMIQMLALASAMDIFKEFLIFQFLPDRLNLIVEEAQKEKPHLGKFEDETELEKRAAAASLDESRSSYRAGNPLDMESGLGVAHHDALLVSSRRQVSQRGQACYPPNCGCHPSLLQLLHWRRSQQDDARRLATSSSLSSSAPSIPRARASTADAGRTAAEANSLRSVEPSQAVLDSSFDFNHVERKTTTKTNDQPARPWARHALRLPKRHDGDSEGTDHAPEESNFWQQTQKSTQVIASGPKALICLSFAGTISLVIALTAMYNGKTAGQVVIQYAGEEKPLWFAEDSETFKVDCPVADPQGMDLCCVTVTAQDDLNGPVQVMYMMTPYYQNHLHYLQSNLWIESWGDVWSFSNKAKLRHDYCKPGITRVTSDGRQIYPCGLHAYSFFNDSFSIPGYDLEQTDIAWKTDVKKFRNPPKYGDNGTKWLYESYPGIISEEEGARNEHFIVWMRTAGLNYVFNRYGTFAPDGIAAGEKIQVCMDARYPVPEDVRKYVVIAEPTVMGIRNSQLGMFAVTASVLCYFASLLTFCVLTQCPRAPGRPRYHQRTRLHPFGTWHGQDEFFNNEDAAE